MYQLAIVEDELVTRNGLEKYVPWEEMGFKVVAAFPDGVEALAWLQEHPCDVVLSDIMMSRMTGVELAARLNRDFPQIKVVLLSGYRIFEYAKQAIQYQVVDYLLKPVDEDELVKVFERIKGMLDRENDTEQLSDMSDNKAVEALNSRDEQSIREILLFKHKLLLAMMDLDRPELLSAECERMTRMLSQLSIEAAKDVMKEIYVQIINEYSGRDISLAGDDVAFSYEKLSTATTHEALAVQVEKDLLMLNASVRKVRSERNTDIVGSIVKYIDHNIGGDLSVSNIPMLQRSNLSYISRSFKQKTGERMSDYIIRIRMETAILILKEKRCSIQQISQSVGYSTPSYFASVFRNFTGLSPKEFYNRVIVP